MRRLLIVLIVAGGAVAAGALIIHHFTGGATDPTGYQVASAIGAGDCNRSDYAIEDRLTGKSTAIYDCWKSNKGYFCVTIEERREAGLSDDLADVAHAGNRSRDAHDRGCRRADRADPVACGELLSLATLVASLVDDLATCGRGLSAT